MASLDGRKVEVIDTEDTVLTVLVYPDGTIRLQTNQKMDWVVDMLQRIAKEYAQVGPKP